MVTVSAKCLSRYNGEICSLQLVDRVHYVPSVVRAFAHGVMGRQIDPSWGGPIELFLVPASAPQLV